MAPQPDEATPPQPQFRLVPDTKAESWIRRNRLPLIVSLALLMQTTDATILSTALPAISEKLGIPVLSLKLAISSYLITLAALVPLSGWIADRFGARRTFLGAMTIFTAGSLFCAFQDSLAGLVVGRIIQGCGGALMVPVGRLIVVRSSRPDMLVRDLSYVAMTALIGPAIGPLLGAALTASLGWEYIFLVNVPIGVAAVILASRFLPTGTDAPATEGTEIHRPALERVLFLSGGMVLLLISLSLLGDGLVPLPLVAASAAAGIVLLMLYGRRYKMDQPRLLDISLLKIHSLRTALLGSLLIRVSAGGATFLLPLLFQIGFGLPILASGALSSVYAVGALTMRAGGPWLYDRFGFRPVLMAGSLISVASIVGFGFISRVDYPQIILLMLIGGIAQGIVFGGANAMAFADVGKRDEASANTMSQLGLQLSMTMGVAVAAISAQLAGNPSVNETPLAEHFPPAFHVLAAIGLLGALSFSRLRPSEGNALRKGPVNGTEVNLSH